MNRPVSLILLSLVILAALGLGSELINDPSGLLSSILVFAIVAGIIILVFKRVNTSSEQKAYSKAAKQSKKQQQHRGRGDKKANVVSYSLAQSKKNFKNRKKSDVQLTVIEGKKGKKKNRA